MSDPRSFHQSNPWAQQPSPPAQQNGWGAPPQQSLPYGAPVPPQQPLPWGAPVPTPPPGMQNSPHNAFYGTQNYPQPVYYQPQSSSLGRVLLVILALLLVMGGTVVGIALVVSRPTSWRAPRARGYDPSSNAAPTTAYSEVDVRVPLVEKVSGDTTLTVGTVRDALAAQSDTYKTCYHMAAESSRLSGNEQLEMRFEVCDQNGQGKLGNISADTDSELAACVELHLSEVTLPSPGANCSAFRSRVRFQSR